jgi:CheY-specific phosphatase CheX
MAVKFFGQYLVEKGIISAEAILAAIGLQERTNLKLGEMALSLGLVSQADIERAHQSQLSKDMKLGDLLVSMGMLSQAQLEQVIARQKETHLYIGEALVKIGALTPQELDVHLAGFKLDQAPYAIDRVELPAGLANAETWEMTVDLTYKLITRVLDLRFKPETCRVVERLEANHMVAAMDLSGDVQARYLVSVSQEVQKQMARAILHEDSVEHEPVEVLEDSVMEFINVVCGNVAAKASQTGTAITINPPVTLHPPAEGLPTPPDTTTLCFPIHLEDGDRMLLYLVLPK